MVSLPVDSGVSANDHKLRLLLIQIPQGTSCLLFYNRPARVIAISYINYILFNFLWLTRDFQGASSSRFDS